MYVPSRPARHRPRSVFFRPCYFPLTIVVARGDADAQHRFMARLGIRALAHQPLAQAIASGDHIYGIIKASAVNHGAKSNGYTVPNQPLFSPPASPANPNGSSGGSGGDGGSGDGGTGGSGGSGGAAWWRFIPAGAAA